MKKYLPTILVIIVIPTVVFGLSSTVYRYQDNYGMGTTTPQGILHISDDAPKLYITDTGDYKHFLLSSDGGEFNIASTSDDFLTTTNFLNIDTSSNLNLGSGLTDVFTVDTDNTVNIGDGGESMRIDSSGNVGIGTTSPSSKFSMNSGTSGFRIDSSGIVQQGTWQGTAIGSAYLDPDVLTWTKASTTYGVIAGQVWTGVHDFGGATSLEICQDCTIDTTGEVSWDTTSGQFQIYDGTAIRVLATTLKPLKFTYSTTTAWTATTTIQIPTDRWAETYYDGFCYTDTGTLNVQFSDAITGGNLLNMFNASTTIGTITFSGSTTFTAKETKYVRIGTPASTPTQISCTVYRYITAD